MGPRTGDIYLNSHDFKVEILAVATVASETWGEEIDVIVYRVVGATMVHVRPADHVDNWKLIPEG